METTLGELVGRLGGELVGDPSVVVRQIAALDKAGEGDLAFLASPKYRSALEASKASAFILSPKAADFTDRPRILTPDPYLYFARAAQLFQAEAEVRPAAGIHASAHPGFMQQVHRDLLQDAGPDAAQHIVTALALKDDVVDASLVQQLAKQQAGRAGADDGQLGSHECLLGICMECLDVRH